MEVSQNMKVTAISFLFLLVIPLASAISFDFNYPDSVTLNENFSVSIAATTSDVYDVKIFVQNNQTGVIISDIYNEGWKNPYYYIKSVFPEQTTFSVKVKNYSDDSAICARLRKTGSSSYSEKCGKISIENTQQGSATDSSEDEESEIQEENISQNPEQTSQDFVPASTEEEKNQVLYSPDSSEKIFLSPKKSSESSFISSEGKLRSYVLYFFMVLVIILCIYLAFKKL